MKKLFWLVLLIASPAWSATYYVSKTGLDAHACSTTDSAATNRLTIGAGIACLSAGDTLIVHAGTYSENLVNVIPSGTAGNPTIIQHYQTDIVWIQPPGPASPKGSSSARILIDSASYITVDGIGIDGTNHIGGVTAPTNAGDVGTFYCFKTLSSHIIYKNAECKNAIVGIQDGGSFNQWSTLHIHNITIHNEFAPTGDNVAGYGTYNPSISGLIENCYIHDTAGYGLLVYGSGLTDRDNNVVRGNILDRNGLSGFGPPGGGAQVGSGKNLLFYNNIISNGGGLSIGLTVYQAPGAGIYNNTFFNITRSDFPGAIDMTPDSIGTQIKNNLFYQIIAPFSVRVASTSGVICSNNLNATNCGTTAGNTDPVFINPGIGDFHLNSNSPARDSGITVSVNTDKDGVPRPQGDQFDIGAYEYVISGRPIEAFDYVATSSIDGQAGGTNWLIGSKWFLDPGCSANAATIESAPAGSFTGGNALKSSGTGGQTCISRSFNPTSIGVITAQIQSSINNSGFRAIILQNNLGQNLINVAMKDDGHLHACPDLANDTDLAAYSTGQMYFIQVELDVINQANKYRVFIDQNAPSSWIDFCVGSGTIVSKFFIFDNTSAAHDFYVDSIGSTAPTVVRGVFSPSVFGSKIFRSSVLN